ncbi:hypothetical protein Hypma_008985 [Hypsizygus marmoreus]|uniref:GH16 domain-containing protein n=1 Tax=Hypsizygus marmoreus TaxID=39966 RepID=A0A369JP77_HYPMA|nr:hypothetical protein Hypma_008985 [Hypsizygus marmoreus]
MLFSTTLLLISLSFGAVAGNTHSASSMVRHRAHARAQGCTKSNFTRSFTLTDMYQGEGFLNGWNFFTGADPTHGNVKYQSKSNAIAKRLAFVQDDGTTVLAVDDKTTLPVGGKRDSVRISTKKKYNGGLFIADIFSMPHGCSVWPAYWSVGPNWPLAGEIDVLEGVHDQPTNQYALHTSTGCTLSTGDLKVPSKLLGKQCASSGSSNAGCGFLDTDTRTYGKGFNAIGGGVYAHVWDSTGIKVWHFPRTDIPEDITTKNPDPSTWGTPTAFWSDSSCDMATHFFDHALVIDTTICGDFAGATYKSAGCPGTCAQAVADPKNYSRHREVEVELHRCLSISPRVAAAPASDAIRCLSLLMILGHQRDGISPCPAKPATLLRIM